MALSGNRRLGMRSRWSLGRRRRRTRRRWLLAKPGLQAKLPDGLKQHGDKVDKVAAGQDRQEL